MDSTKVKVFANLCDDIIEFESVEDFDNYYRKNKDFIDQLSTRGLNQKFKIKNHHIGRLKNQITLYPLKQTKITNNTAPPSLDIADESGVTLHEKLNSINNRLKNLEENVLSLLDEMYEEILSFKNEQSKQTKQQSMPTMPPSMQQQQINRTIPSGFSTFGL